MRALLRRTPLTLVALPVALVAIPLLPLSLGIKLPLDPLCTRFEAATSPALGRAVTLEGSMLLLPTFSPRVEVRGPRIFLGARPAEDLGGCLAAMRRPET